MGENLALEAAKYLVQLYASTIYECNRQKLQKLILFAHFALLLDNHKGILGDEFVTASHIGLGIESVSNEFYFFGLNGINERSLINGFQRKDESYFTPKFQYDSSKLTVHVTQVLMDFFVFCGAYHKDDLSDITRELSIYPDADFLNWPDATMYLDASVVNRYIMNTRQNYSNVPVSGTEIMKNEINKALFLVDQKRNR